MAYGDRLNIHCCHVITRRHIDTFISRIAIAYSHFIFVADKFFIFNEEIHDYNTRNKSNMHIYYSKNSAGLRTIRLQSCGMNRQFPYKRSILCQCLKINWNNICCYHINLIYNVCVFLLLLLFFCVYYCNVMFVWSGQDVSFLFLCELIFTACAVTMGCQHCWANGFFGSLSFDK